MVITKKIEKPSKDNATERQKIILKGGAVVEDVKKKNREKRTILLRVPVELLERVDKLIESLYGIKRSGWILQAMQEKWEREDRQDQSFR